MTRAKDMSDFGVSASAGAIVNVQQAVKLGTQNVTSTSYVLLTGLTIDITPKIPKIVVPGINSISIKISTMPRINKIPKIIISIIN